MTQLISDGGVNRLPAFVLGIWLATCRVEPRSVYLRYGWLLAILAAIYKYVASYGLLSVVENYTYLIFCAGIVSLCYLLIKVAPFLKAAKIYSVFCFVGRHSLELYLWHEYIYCCVGNLHLNPVPSFVIAVMLSVVAATLSHRLLHRLNLV